MFCNIEFYIVENNSNSLRGDARPNEECSPSECCSRLECDHPRAACPQK